MNKAVTAITIASIVATLGIAAPAAIIPQVHAFWGGFHGGGWGFHRGFGFGGFNRGFGWGFPGWGWGGGGWGGGNGCGCGGGGW